MKLTNEIQYGSTIEDHEKMNSVPLSADTKMGTVGFLDGDLLSKLLLATHT